VSCNAEPVMLCNNLFSAALHEYHMPKEQTLQGVAGVWMG